MGLLNDFELNNLFKFDPDSAEEEQRESASVKAGDQVDGISVAPDVPKSPDVSAAGNKTNPEGSEPSAEHVEISVAPASEKEKINSTSHAVAAEKQETAATPGDNIISNPNIPKSYVTSASNPMGVGAVSKANTPSVGQTAGRKGIPPSPKIRNIPKFPRDKYIDISGKKLKISTDGKYTFTCPNCGTTLTDEDCVIDFYRAIKRYMTSVNIDASEATEALTKMFFPKDGGNICVFYEADWATVEALEKDENGYTVLRCSDLLLCMMRKVIKDLSPDDLKELIPNLINDKNAMYSEQRDEFFRGLIVCLGKCGVLNKRRDEPADLTTLSSGATIEATKVDINQLRIFLKQLYNNQDEIVLRAKISRHLEERYDGEKFLAGFDFEFGIHDKMMIIERRCPQAECGKCVSHLNGMAEEYVIGMLGGPGSGKTAYMTALLNFLDKGSMEDGKRISLSRCGVKTNFDPRDCDGGMGDFIKTYLEKYKNGEFVRKTEVGDGQHYSFHVHGKACPHVPGKNPVDNSVFSPNKYEDIHKIITVVDIAGEQLSDRENLQAVVSRADLFWFCISPGQLDPSAKKAEETGYSGGKAAENADSGYRISDISGIIRNIHSMYENGISVPISLIITKSDIFSGSGDLCPQVYMVQSKDKDDTKKSIYVGMADMINLTPDEGGKQLNGGSGFTGYKVRAIGRYQDAIQTFFKAEDRRGESILNELYGDLPRKCAFFACAAYGTSEAGSFQPYGVFQPLLWTLAVLGVLPVVSPAEPVTKTVGFFRRRKVEVYNENYQARVFTPSVLCPGTGEAEKFEKLLFW